MSYPRDGCLHQESSSLMKVALQASVILEQLPKSSIDIYGVVLESDGGELAVLITAASAALAAVGIEMVDLAVACQVVSWHEKAV